MRLSDDSRYRRLMTAGHGLTSSVSYWAGPDHLLVVQVSGYVEAYRRVAYRDVQALVLRRTRRGRVLGITLALGCIGCLTLLLVLVAAASGGDWSLEAKIWSGILEGLALVIAGLLVGNWLLGPTCDGEVRTAVQSLVLPGLYRLRKVERLVAALTPLVLQAQGGQASPGAGIAAARDDSAPPETVKSEGGPPRSDAPGPPPAPPSGSV